MSRRIPGRDHSFPVGAAARPLRSPGRRPACPEQPRRPHVRQRRPPRPVESRHVASPADAVAGDARRRRSTRARRATRPVGRLGPAPAQLDEPAAACGRPTSPRPTGGPATDSSCTTAARPRGGAPDHGGAARPRRRGRPHAVRHLRPHRRDRALRPGALPALRELRRAADPGGDPGRAAGPGLGAPHRAGAGSRGWNGLRSGSSGSSSAPRPTGRSPPRCSCRSARCGAADPPGAGVSVEALDEIGGGVADLFADAAPDPMAVVQARETMRQLNGRRWPGSASATGRSCGSTTWRTGRSPRSGGCSG